MNPPLAIVTLAGMRLLGTTNYGTVEEAAAELQRLENFTGRKFRLELATFATPHRFPSEEKDATPRRQRPEEPGT